MKKNKRLPGINNREKFKILLLMKLIAPLLLIFMIQLSVSAKSQNKITAKFKNTELIKAINLVESQSDYRFVYNNGLIPLEKKIDATFREADLPEVMEKLLSGTGLSYKMMKDNLVVLYLREDEVKDIPVKGIISDENGKPLEGASVKVKGSKTGGTFTTASGEYSITVPDNAVLIISYVGFEDQEIAVGGRTSINVTLKASTAKMDEVVVIGYGTANRRDLTGSIAKVKGADIASQPNTNPLASLQSKVAGLSIVNNADPGSTPDVRIRGTISIGTVNPTYIIDGIFSDNMDFVNPNEIESIEILKDPSSLAVFGFKGAAGAILVTTKRAKAGQVNVNFNSTIGTKHLTDKIKLANGNEFRSLATFEGNVRYANDSTDAALRSFVNDPMGLAAYTGNTNWIDAVSRTALYNTSNIGVDAGTDKNRFHMGVGYTIDEGLVKHIKYERLNINISDEYKLSSRFKVGFNVVATREHIPYNSGALENSRRSLPIVSDQTKAFTITNPYGLDIINANLYSSTPIIQNSETNPLATLEYNWNKKVDYRFRYVGSAFVEINVTKDLNLRGTWYANISNEDNREYTPLYSLYDPTVTNQANQPFLRNSLTAIQQQLINTKAFQQDYIATYKKKLGDHSITATAGFTTYYNNYSIVTGNNAQKEVGANIIPNDPRFWYLSSGFGSSSAVTTSSQNEYATVSYLARALYNYKSKYFFNASYRRDYASQINNVYSKKGQDFWAFGAAWEISKENFMEKQTFFNSLKLKGSVGKLGNFNPLGIAYPAYPTVSSVSSAVFGNTLVPVYQPNYLFDANLHWENVNSSEVGIEADFLQNRLHFEAVYYSKTTKDLLVLLRPIGVLPTLRNFGSIKNSGFEFTANFAQPLSKDLTLTLGANLTTFKNKVLSLAYPYKQNNGTNLETPDQTETGQPIGYFYGLVVDGIYQTQDEINRSTVKQIINGDTPKPGDFRYKDLNGDDTVDVRDRTNIGNPTPKFAYGFSASLKYKGFDLGVDLGGVYGNKIYRVWGTSEQLNSVYNYPEYYTQAWTGPGTSNTIPIVNTARKGNRAPSTYGIESGSYLRIRNLTLGYSLTKFSNKTSIKSLRIFVSVQNLKTWKNNLGYSPEYAGNATTFGIDRGSSSSALPRITSFGFNLNF